MPDACVPGFARRGARPSGASGAPTGMADMPQVAPSVATSMWGLAAAHHEVPVPERRGAVCRCVHHGYRSPLSNDLLL